MKSQFEKLRSSVQLKARAVVLSGMSV